MNPTEVIVIRHAPRLGHDWPLRWMGIILMLLCLASGWHDAIAQSRIFDATSLNEPTPLVEGWLVHAGDDPAYSRPEFDDSRWTPFNAQTDDLHNLFPHQPEIVWYRLHLRVAPNQTRLAFLEQSISQAFEVYSNGLRLIQAGRIRPFIAYNTNAQLVVPIPGDQIASGSLVIALRAHISRDEWTFPGGAGYSSTGLLLGMERTLHEHAWYLAMTEHALDWLDYAVNICLLMGGVMLYSTQRDRLEYLWLPVWALAYLSIAPLSLYSLFHIYPLRWHFLDTGIICFLGLYSVMKMYCAFVGHQVGWRLQAYVLVSAACMYFGNIAFILGLTVNVRLLASVPLVVFFTVVIPFIVVLGVHRGRSAELLLLLPVFLIGLSFGITDCVELMYQIPALRDLSLRFLPMAFGTHAGPFYLEYDFLADIIAKLSLALIILIRSNRMSRQQALLESEMASAREVQQVILPEALGNIPGFHIESIYQPASEVGGDFFQVLPVADKGVLVVIGDVAGKGLPAAMLVSVLVGAIRSVAEFTYAPDQILSHLNERMIGRSNGGFATALVALITTDGKVTIANAGHLPPYLNGHEIELSGALPLGIVSGAQYQITQLLLAPSSCLTFYSDGVIEAQDRFGNLLGFDRARELSTQSAAAIAEAAKTFGQQDDITVITLERVAGEEKRNVEQSTAVWVPAP